MLHLKNHENYPKYRHNSLVYKHFFYINNIRKINICLIPVLIFTVDDGKNELEILDGE